MSLVLKVNLYLAQVSEGKSKSVAIGHLKQHTSKVYAES
jgi:hypothetical protein